MRRLLTFCFALTAVGVMSLPVQAGWLTAYSGNGLFSDGEELPPGFDVSAEVSVAVWENTVPGSFATLLSNLGITVDYDNNSAVTNLDAKYVYLYQVTNKILPNETRDVSALAVPISPTSVVSAFGYLIDTVFDDGTAVGSAGNWGLGDDATVDDTFKSYDLYAGPAITFASNSSAIGLDEVRTKIETNVPTEILFDFGQILDGETSALVFFTSNNGPMFVPTAMVNDTGKDSDGITVTATPVPAGLALFLTGLPCLGMVTLRRKNVGA